MCIDILRSPVSAFADAKKKQNINKTLAVLGEASVLFAVSASLMTVRTLFSSTGFLGVASMATFVFLLSFLSLMLIGLVVNIVATMLGGKGSYFDGLTAVTYSSVFLSTGLFLASAIIYVPIAGLLLSAIILLPAFAAGFASFYRGIKEMYKTDTITAFVTVSVTTLTLVMVVQMVLIMRVLSTVSLSPVALG